MVKLPKVDVLYVVCLSVIFLLHIFPQQQITYLCFKLKCVESVNLLSILNKIHTIIHIQKSVQIKKGQKSTKKNEVIFIIY